MSVCGKQLRERAPLRRLAAREAAGAVERDVGLGMQRVALEDDEPCVDPSAPERLRRRPRDAGRVDRAEGDAQRATAGSLGADVRRALWLGVGGALWLGAGRVLRVGVVDVLWAGVGGALRAVVGDVLRAGVGGAHRWRNRLTPGTIPALTRDTRRGTVPVPPGGWGLGMG